MFRLARELRMTVSELGERMDAREFLEWSIFLSMEAEEQKRDSQPGVLSPKTPAEEVEAFKAVTGAK